MLMGFVNGGRPPFPRAEQSPANEPPRDGKGNVDGPSAATVAAARAATSRYRRPREGLGKYAWAISLGLHAVVLIGAYVAVRYYFPHTQTRAPAPPGPSENAAADLIVPGPDATDAIHGRWTGGSILTDGSSFDTDAGREIPTAIAREPQTVITLHDLTPRSGVEALDSPWIHDLTPPVAFKPSPAGTRPNPF